MRVAIYECSNDPQMYHYAAVPLESDPEITDTKALILTLITLCVVVGLCIVFESVNNVMRI